MAKSVRGKASLSRRVHFEEVLAKSSPFRKRHFEMLASWISMDFDVDMKPFMAGRLAAFLEANCPKFNRTLFMKRAQQ